jgi:hypothetical protein
MSPLQQHAGDDERRFWRPKGNSPQLVVLVASQLASQYSPDQTTEGIKNLGSVVGAFVMAADDGGDTSGKIV